MTNFTYFYQHLPWVTIFGVLGNTISFLAILSPIPTFYRIYKKKSTEEFQNIPYAMGLFSGCLWLFYAIVKTDVIFLLTINSFDVLIEIIYLSIFFVYANKQTRINMVKLLLIFNTFGLAVVIFFALVIAKTHKARVTLLGWVCLIFSSSVYASPLGIMRKVIRTRSVKYMPFLLSLFLTISGFVWFFYGLCKHDLYIAIPNIIGFSFGMVQMVLYTVYRNAKPVSETLPIDKKGISNNKTVLEPVKIPPKSSPSSDGDVAISITNTSNTHDVSVTNEREEATDSNSPQNNYR